MDCKTAEQLVAYLAPGKSELDAEHSAALEAHVRACPECARRIRFAQSFDQGVARVMRSVPVPAGLKERIKAKLTPTRVAWHRRRSVRTWAAAAAVLIATGIVLTWNGSDKMPLNPQHVADVESRSGEGQAQAARDWLRSEGIDFAPEEPLNLALASAWGIAPFADTDKNVPMVLLVSPHPSAVARVYVLRSDEFDLKSIQDSPDSSGRFGPFGHRVIIVRDSNQPAKIAYVIVLSNDNLDPFRDRSEAISI